MLLLEAIKLIIFLAALAYSADKLISTSCRLARALGVSAGVIGLTMVAYGTSLPEFAVSAISSFEAHSELSVANILGTNMFNICVVGLVALLAGGIVVKDTLLARRDNIVLFLSTALIAVLFFFGGITKPFGASMIILILAYTVYAIRHDRKNNSISRDENISWKIELAKSLLLMLAVVVSAKYLVASATNIATILGISEWIIGATIVAFGTSMPEATITVIAALKKETGLSIGTMVGSITFNILWVLGFAAMLNPLVIPFAEIRLDLAALVLMTFLFSAGLFKRKITRPEGMLYVLIYMGYLGYLFGLV